MINSFRKIINREKVWIKRLPVLGTLTRQIYKKIIRKHPEIKPFSGSEDYWEERYADGGNSGAGSYGKLAKFKAEVVNTFIAENGVHTVIEFGCGDGNQLRYMNYPHYIGFDVSESAILLCINRFASDKSKDFRLIREFNNEVANLTLSLDVIYHLVEDNVFETYMKMLFRSSSQYVIIYSSDSDDNLGSTVHHIKHRKFSDWIQNNLPGWELKRHIPNKYPYTGDYLTSSYADFFIYEKI